MLVLVLVSLLHIAFSTNLVTILRVHKMKNEAARNKSPTIVVCYLSTPSLIPPLVWNCILLFERHVDFNNSHDWPYFSPISCDPIGDVQSFQIFSVISSVAGLPNHVQTWVKPYLCCPQRLRIRWTTFLLKVLYQPRVEKPNLSHKIIVKLVA